MQEELDWIDDPKRMRSMKQIDRRISVAPMMDWTDVGIAVTDS